jgi:hypothetical protein
MTAMKFKTAWPTAAVNASKDVLALKLFLRQRRATR